MNAIEYEQTTNTSFYETAGAGVNTNQIKAQLRSGPSGAVEDQTNMRI